MGSLNYMKKKLEPLSLYNLDGDNLVMAELTTYANELDRVYDELYELERECFIKTAISYGLSLRERNYTSPRVDVDINDRRNMLLYRLSITSNDFSKASIEKALNAAGIDGYIIEFPSERKIEVNVLDLFDNMVTDYESKVMAEKFMPAHLKYYFDFRPLQWQQIDAEDLTYYEFDQKNLTWEQLDGYYD